ncbi:AAA family ATPase [Anabaena azotica]|uniref:ATP-binding protein n=1 Tax=Anabaena azotica FACHB-119 TaxID=947527 RepID=A0ABR8DCC8_9NOST|nr:ATP-binding protein [Anabaena azotica]MBD2503796.1 ATP-binding protein [Anabaena azotica FACHB-119]
MIGNIGSLKPCLSDLLQALQELDKLLEQAGIAAETAYGAESVVDSYRGLYINQNDVERILQREPVTSPLRSPTVDLGKFLANISSYSSFKWLQQTFGLSDFDIALILIVLAPDIDLRYERIYAYLQDDVTRKRPTVDLALNLLCNSAQEKLAKRIHFAADAPLIHQGLLHVIPDPNQIQPSLLAHYLKLDEQITRILLGEPGLDQRLVRFCYLRHSKYLLDDLPLTADIKQGLKALTVQAWQTRSSLHLYFHGFPGLGKEKTAEALANYLGVPLITADLLLALDLKVDWEYLLQLLFREAQHHNAIIYLPRFDELLAEDGKVITQNLLNILVNYQGIAILAGKKAWQNKIAHNLNIIAINFTLPDLAQRRAFWQSNLAQAGIQLPEDELESLVSRFRLTPAQISKSVITACNQALWQEAKRNQNIGDLSTVEANSFQRSKVKEDSLPPVLPSISDLFAAARMQSGEDLAALARKIHPKYTWNDIILAADQIDQLREICHQAKYRSVVYGQWGFGRKLSLGKGLNVLFSGSPGTGKTMAAEVIANELQIDLYKIDLSQVVSKYIGETEKNLDRIFTAAQSANAILFFDEADALFGKRSQVKDAHDRYANIEVGYLLQKMEEYEGVAILATNLRDNMDDAFVRRIQIIVEFPFPNEEDRQRIWQVIFPPEAPLGEDVDFGVLAKEIKLAGGNIKNIGLAAAFYAASDGDAIQMSHLIKAAAREHQKLGRTWQMHGL